MNTFLKLVPTLLALWVYFTVRPGKADSYHLVCGGIALALVAVMALVRASREEKTSEETATQDPELAALLQQAGGGENPGGALLKGTLAAVAVFVLAVGLAAVGSRTPVYGMFYDTEFGQFVRELDVLTQAGNLEAANSRIDSRLREPLSVEKQKQLAELKYQYLIQLGKRAATSEQQQKWFGEAEDWARKWKLDASLANAERRAAQPTPTAVPTPTAMPIPTARPAVVVTVTPTPRPTPRPLPQGAWGRILSVRKDTATAFVDLTVETVEGSIPGLTANDLHVWVNGALHPIEDTYLVTYQELPQPMYITVVFDQSGSMLGEPLHKAKEAVKALVSTRRDHDRVRIVSFSDEVSVSEWMSPVEALTTVEQIQARGNTALWDAVLAASKDIPGRPHIIVAFTDGADNMSRLTNLGLAAKAVLGNLIYAVGVESQDFKPDQLQRFAKDAEGQYLPSSVQTLVETFNSIASATKKIYRLVVFTPAVEAENLRILVGGQVELTWKTQ